MASMIQTHWVHNWDTEMEVVMEAKAFLKSLHLKNPKVQNETRDQIERANKCC